MAKCTTIERVESEGGTIRKGALFESFFSVKGGIGGNGNFASAVISGAFKNYGHFKDPAGKINMVNSKTKNI